MLYDFNRRTVGGYTLQATVTGSYGEKCMSRVGRSYPHLGLARLARERMKAKYPDVIIVDPHGRACMPEIYDPIWPEHAGAWNGELG